MLKSYDWQRYWYKNDSSPLIINGFLYVHEYTKDVFTLDSVSNMPCLILRGEPGTGKSREIERICKAQIVDEGNDKLYFPLNSYSDEIKLIKEIFESDEIERWKENDNNLYLFLDSLDEALLNINTLALSLANELGKIVFKGKRKNLKQIDSERRLQKRTPSERLFLRVACRTAEWSNLSVLENKLREIWNDDRCLSLQIAPLRQKDVEVAAQSENLDSQKFVAEIYNKSVTALASKPVTLQFLLNLFGKNNSFPSTQTELYEKGCLALCEEKNDRRKASRHTGDFTSEQRLRIAARAAALMIFGNKSSVWLGGLTGEEENSDILISEISGYTEKGKDNCEFQVTEINVRETLFDTALFTGDRNNRLKFSHQTFAEFLASWYLNYRELSDEVIIEIIGKEYLYPQLYETSAWIANQRPAIFHHLMKIAPAVLLRSDILLAENSSKVKLVDILLDLFDKEELQGIDRNYYRKLAHPEIAEQIKPYLINKTKKWLVRSEAIDIAQMCEVKELQNDLADIALDKKDDQNIRVHAAYAVAWIGDSETRARLKPLVFGKEDDDERFRLKGVALHTLWNEHLTAEELFSVLSLPSNRFIGSYESFFDSEMIAKLKAEDLPVALDWLIENIDSFGYLNFSERRLADKILIKAWDNLEETGVFERFVKVSNKLISNHEDIFKEIEDEKRLNEILQENDKRRKIWLEIFSSINDKKYWSLEDSKFIGLRNEDINWLVQEWNKTEDETLKTKLLSRIKGFVSFWGTHPDVLDALDKACKENEILKKEFEEIFAPVELNSEKAKRQKKHHEETFKWRKEREKELEELKQPAIPSPMELTLKSLEEFERDEINAFINVNYYLMFMPNGRTEKSDLNADLTELPVWNEVDENTKSRIIQAAKKYLEKGDPKNEKWIGTKSFEYSALAGYKAITLLEKFEPAFIEKLPKSIWGKWSAVIYYYPIFNGSGNEEYERHRQLIAKTYKIVPEKIIELFNQDIDSKSEESYWSFERLKYCWDDKLKNVLKEKLKNNHLPISTTRSVLSQLFELKDIEVEEIACDFIRFPIPQYEKEQALLMTSVELLIAHGSISCWEKIWRILKSNIEFGRKVIEFSVFRFRRFGIQNLPEKQTSDLYVWLSEQYPHSEDPVHYGSYSPNERDEIVRWRDSLLETLIQRGTAEAVEEIKRIKDQLPHLEWLKFTLLKAEEKMQAASWRPHSPENLIKMFCLKREQKTKHEKVNLDLPLENIERKIDLLLSKIDKAHGQLMEQFANSAMTQVQNDILKLSQEEKEQFEEVKKGRWETKLKFVIPLIPKIPLLGDFFPNASIETTKNIESDEFIDFVQRKFYGESLQTNILQHQDNVKGLSDN